MVLLYKIFSFTFSVWVIWYLVMLTYITKKKLYLILGIKKGPNIKRIFLITFSMGNVDVTLLFHMDFSDYRVFESNRDKVA